MRTLLKAFCSIYKNFFTGRKTFAVIAMIMLMGILTLSLWYPAPLKGMSSGMYTVILTCNIFYTIFIWIGLPCFFYLVDKSHEEKLK